MKLYAQSDHDVSRFGDWAMGNQIVDEIEDDPTLKARVINSIQESSVEALKQVISYPSAAIVTAGVQGFIEG